MLNQDICDLTEDTLSTALDGQKVDLIIGGPPCQSYSTLGKRQMDHRANLFVEYKRILEILRPRAFVFENVVGAAQHGSRAAVPPDHRGICRPWL